MGKKKIFVIFALVIVLLIGWVLAIKAVTRMDEIKKQNKLIAQADSFMQRELYVRAIPLYEEAGKIKTKDDRAFALETRLMQAYLLHEDYEKYAKIVEKRADNNTATVDDYKNTFNYYVSNNRMEKAFTIIHKGIDQTDDADLKDLYEQYRFIYKLRNTRYGYVLPTVDNAIMPAFDGEKWGYITSGGGGVLSPKYDEATAFTSDGLAAVLKDGEYMVVTVDGDKYGRDDNPNASRIEGLAYVFGSCIIAKKDGKYGFFDYDFNQMMPTLQFDEVTRASYGVIVAKNGNEWGIYSLGDGSLVKGGIEDVAVNTYGSVFSEGRGMIKIGGKWHLVNTSGEDIISETFDDVRAPESEGYIAVADNAGRWGFINDQGEHVIDYKYIDAFSFSDDVAAVKTYNDRWVYITAKDVPISEENFEEAMPFHGGVGQVYENGMAYLIIFNYYGQ
jgi:tetratricopeptide (TPR) repeat protein